MLSGYKNKTNCNCRDCKFAVNLYGIMDEEPVCKKGHWKIEAYEGDDCDKWYDLHDNCVDFNTGYNFDKTELIDGNTYELTTKTICITREVFYHKPNDSFYGRDKYGDLELVASWDKGRYSIPWFESSLVVVGIRHYTELMSVDDDAVR